MGLERFNYPDGTTSVAGITAVSNNLVINDGKAYISASSPPNFFLIDGFLSEGVAEMYASAPEYSSKQYGFILRYVDPGNCILVTVADGSAGTCRIIKKEGGSETILDESYSGEYSQDGNKLRLAVDRNRIDLFVNDSLAVSAESSFQEDVNSGGFKMDDPSIGIHWISYQDISSPSVIREGKGRSATKLGQIVPMHSEMVASGVSAEYWPYVVRGDTVPNWPSTKYPLIMYTSPDHAEAGQNVGVYVRVYNAELGLETETAAWEEWQDVSGRSEFDHIAQKTCPIFTESAAPSETPTVISSNGTVYLFTHNILNPDSSGATNQGTSLAKGTNGIDFTSVASPLLSYDANKEQGDMHTGYANIIENPIPSSPYTHILSSTHGGGIIDRGPTHAIWGTSDIEDPDAYELITTMDRITDSSMIRGYTPDGWSVTWMVILSNISTLIKEGPYFRAVMLLKKDIVDGGNDQPVLPIEVLLDEGFNVVSRPRNFISLGASGEADEAEIHHYMEVEYNGASYAFYRAKALDGSTSIAMADVEQVNFDWEVIHPRSNETELLKVNPNNYSAISATSSPAINADGLMEFPLDSSGAENVINIGSYTLSDYDVLEFKVKRQAQTGIQDIYGEIGFFDDIDSPGESFRLLWPDNNNALRFNVLANGVSEDFGESRKIVGNYDIYTADNTTEHYNSRIWYGLRIIPSLRKVQLLGGTSVIGEYYLKDIDLTQPLNLAMKFSTPSGENTSMEIEEITVNSYSNEARAASTPTVNAGVNDAGLVGDTVQLNGTASDYDTLQWTCTSGQTPIFSDAAILNPTVTFDEAGVHNLRLTATNAQGSTSDDVEFVITEEVDSTPPQITFEGGSTITLMVGDPYTPQVTAIDANDGALTPTISNPVDTDMAGTYTVTATATDAAGNVGSATQTVIVEEVPVNQPPVANAGPNQSVAAGVKVQLNGLSSTPGVSFNWYQVSGSPVNLRNSNTATPSFTSPAVSDAGDVVIGLTVELDGLVSTESTVTISYTAFTGPTKNPNSLQSNINKKLIR